MFQTWAILTNDSLNIDKDLSPCPAPKSTLSNAVCATGSRSLVEVAQRTDLSQNPLKRNGDPDHSPVISQSNCPREPDLDLRGIGSQFDPLSLASNVDDFCIGNSDSDDPGAQGMQ